MQYLDKLNKLNLPNSQYAIFGSGPMAIRGIRESNDFDIIVKKELWDRLIKQYSAKIDKPDCIEIGNIEIYKTWLELTAQIDEMIDSADIIAGFPFVKLEFVVSWKRSMGREKDIRDLELIEKYQRN